MGFLKHFRSKSRLKDSPTSSPKRMQNQARYGRDFTANLPDNVLSNIFTYICPHVRDESYEPSERSGGEGCMLCDLRDLANCARVCRKWYNPAQDLLYSSVRIDAVHYCELEEILAEKRSRKSAFKKTIEAGDVPAIRLSLFCRTVRDNQALATRVQLLKLPYMTRETSKQDLARTVSVLPNLRYVDLPDGVFTGDPSCNTLFGELLARCPDIRKMSYKAGSEQSMEILTKRYWQSLEILELSGIAVEPSTLRMVLGSLPTLHELTISDIPWLDDTIFESAHSLPEFPPLQTLSLERVPRITANGMRTYLSHPQNRAILANLAFNATGVLVQELPYFLWDASNLNTLSIIETVSRSLPLGTAENMPLTSISLKTLHFEIADSEEAHGLQKPASTYYAYLAQSLHANQLPALTQLFVRDPDFPELLLLPPPPAPFAEGGSRASTASMHPPRGFNQPLEVFSKGLDENDWVFTSIMPTFSPNGQRRGSASLSGGRPLSAYSASRGLGPQWAQGGFGGEARKSIIVGNGFGGFLAVPQEETPRPMSAGGAFAGHADAAGWGAASVASLGTQASNGTQGTRMSWLKPPPSLAGSVHSAGSSHQRKGSRHDLWR